MAESCRLPCLTAAPQLPARWLQAARAAPSHRRAQPEQRGGVCRPPQLTSACSQDDASSLSFAQEMAQREAERAAKRPV